MSQAIKKLQPVMVIAKESLLLDPSKNDVAQCTDSV